MNSRGKNQGFEPCEREHANERALKFYRSLGVRTLDEWVLLRINPAELRGAKAAGNM